MDERSKKIWNKTGNILYWFFISTAGLVLLYVILTLFCFASFRIPSDSMEPILLKGDHILVEKFTMGARLFDLKPAFAKERFTIRRTPAWGKVKRNDILVLTTPIPKERTASALT